MCRPGSFFTLQIWAATPSYHSVRERQHFCLRPFLPLFTPLSCSLPTCPGLCFVLLLYCISIYRPVPSLCSDYLVNLPIQVIFWWSKIATLPACRCVAPPAWWWVLVWWTLITSQYQTRYTNTWWVGVCKCLCACLRVCMYVWVCEFLCLCVCVF